MLSATWMSVEGDISAKFGPGLIRAMPNAAQKVSSTGNPVCMRPNRR